MVDYMARYIKNTDKNGIEIYFDGKPDIDVLMKLKKNRWRWFPSKSCWYNRDSPENETLAKELCIDETHTQSSEIQVLKKPTELKPTIPMQQNHSTAVSSASMPISKTKNKVSSLRKDSSEIERDIFVEESFGIKDIRFYYYIEPNGDITICGEIFAKMPLQKSFCLTCTLFDKDNDVIESKKNSCYGGSGVVTSYIKPTCFFDGFPFSFTFFKPNVTVARIKIVPID